MYRYGYGYSVPLGTLLNYNPETDVDVNFLVSGRSGLIMPAIIGDPVTIQLPAFTTKGIGYQYLADNNGLDINNADFAFGMWVRGESDLAPAALVYLGGKASVGTAAENTGSYHFYCNTSGAYGCQIRTSNQFKFPVSTILCTDKQWHFLYMDIQPSTKRLRFFVDGTQYGGNITYTGELTNTGPDMKFLLGTACTGTGSTFYNTAIPNVSYSDIFVVNRILSDVEKLACLMRSYPSDLKAYWPCNSWLNNDVSGNNYHFTTLVSVAQANLTYSDGGSQFCLNSGYSLYNKDNSSSKFYVPFLISGTPISVPSLPSGYAIELFSDGIDFNVPGSAIGHNCTDSMLDFVGDEWDRSNATIYAITARNTALAEGGFYLASLPKRWHISLINKDWINYFSNADYKGKTFAKVTPNSAYDRILLTSIFSSSVDKTGADLIKVLKYTGDSEWYHTIDYYFEDTHICAQRENKVLAFDYATKILSISFDGGLTYPAAKNLTGIATIITDSYIFGNGNIAFASHTKQYLSTDNLATYAETIVLGIDGNEYTPSNYNSFRPWMTEIVSFYNDQEFRIWGCYSIDPGTINTNINVWFTNDNGVTIKSIYKFGVSEPVLNATHIHAVNYNAADGSIIVQTGDTAGTVHIIKKSISDIYANTGDWSLLLSGDNNDGSKITGMAYVDDVMYWCSDSSSLFAQGIFRGKYSAFADKTKWRRANYINNSEKNSYSLLHYKSIMIASVVLENAVYTSVNNGKYFLKHTLAGGPTLMGAGVNGCYTNFLPQNSSGYLRGDILEDGESLTNDSWERGTVIMVKINKI